MNITTTITVPFIEGDGTGPDIWKADPAGVGGRHPEGLRGREGHRLAGGPGRGKGLRPDREMAPGGNPAGYPPVWNRPQGTLDHPGREGAPQPQRSIASGTGPLCLPATGPLLPGCSQPHAAAGSSGHGCFPRKHRGCLCRPRVAGRGPGDLGVDPLDQGKNREERWRSIPGSASNPSAAAGPGGWCAEPFSMP